MHAAGVAISQGEQSIALQAADGRGHYIALDSLRGICACMVVLFHLESDSVISHLGLVRNAFLFVDFFFVLSGFVITESYESKLRAGLSIGRFMALRTGRVYPLHVAILVALLMLQICTLIVPGLAQSGQHSAIGFFATLFLVQIWILGPTVEAWNLPSWSIAAEMWAYLVFACVVGLIGRYRIAIFMVTVMVAPFIINHASNRYLNVYYAGAGMRCLYGFFLGALCNHLLHFRDGATRSDAFWSIAQVIAVAAAITLVWLSGVSMWTYLAPWLFAIVIYSFARKEGILSRFLRRKIFVKLGIWSYSIYMVHVFVQARFVNFLSLLHLRMPDSIDDHIASNINRYAPFPYASDVLTIVMVGVTVAVSALTFRYIEEPGRLWSRKLFGSKVPAARPDVDSPQPA